MPPACSGRSTGSLTRRGRFGDRVHALPGLGLGRDGVAVQSTRGARRRGGRSGWPCLDDGAGWRWSRRARCRNGWRVRGRPCDAGCLGHRPGCWNWRPPAWWAASRLGAGGGVRGQGGAELAAASISLSLSRVHRLRTPAPPPRSRAVSDGRHPLKPPLRRPGAKAPVMAGEAPAVRRAP